MSLNADFHPLRKIEYFSSSMGQETENKDFQHISTDCLYHTGRTTQKQKSMKSDIPNYGHLVELEGVCLMSSSSSGVTSLVNNNEVLNASAMSTLIAARHYEGVLMGTQSFLQGFCFSLYPYIIYATTTPANVSLEG